MSSIVSRSWIASGALLAALLAQMVSVASAASTASPPATEDESVFTGPIGELRILKRYTWDRLDSAANLLRVVSDLETELAQRSFCGLNSPEARALILPLHALIDKKLEQESKRPWQGSRLAQAKLCEVDCHCGLIADALSKGAVDAKLSVIQSQAKVKAAKLSPIMAQTCAKRHVSWFCGSALLKYLKLSAKDSTPEASPPENP